MSLPPDVLQAFELLRIDPSSDLQAATKAYRRQAFIHHPDRNHGDSGATRRFQEIGAAWNICQRHFDKPTWGYSPDRDDDIPLNEQDLNEFYIFVFTETLFDRYTRAQGQRYRYQRSGRAGGGLATFSGGLAESQARQARNTERQRKENEEYEKRKRELELEIEQEERENAEKEKKINADAKRRDHALENAFRAASSGDSAAVKRAILDHDLDVNTPRKRSEHSRKQDGTTLCDTLLHVVASKCDGDLFMFLLERGANPTALNRNQLNPFHSAVKAGNIRVVRFILEHYSRSLEAYHPSKAVASGVTPLQLAIESRVPSVVELLVKYATPHDVSRCWKVETISENIKEILLKKKGFVPPNDSTQVSESSPPNKTQRKQELDAQKQVRMAEELERAAINRKIREDRASRFLEKERVNAAAKLVQARRKAELEELERTNRECQVQTPRETPLETKCPDPPAVASGSKSAKERNRISSETSEKKVALTLNGAHNIISISKDMNQASSSIQTLPTSEIHIKDVKISSSIRPRSSVSGDMHTSFDSGKFSGKSGEKARENDPHSILEICEMQSNSPKNEEAPKHSLKKVKQSRESLEEVRRRKEEAVIRRRAEQSAKDKECHRRKVEEQAKYKRDQSIAYDEALHYNPSTLVSTDTAREKISMLKIKEVTNKSSVSSSPNPFPSAPEFVIPREDIETCIVPEDLFKDEPMIARPVVEDRTTEPSRGRYKRRVFRRPRA